MFAVGQLCSWVNPQTGLCTKLHSIKDFSCIFIFLGFKICNLQIKGISPERKTLAEGFNKLIFINV